MIDVRSCGDSNCVWGDDGREVVTNGGCRCLKNLPTDERLRAERNVLVMRAQMAEAVELLRTAAEEREDYYGGRSPEPWVQAVREFLREVTE